MDEREGEERDESRSVPEQSGTRTEEAEASGNSAREFAGSGSRLVHGS